MSINLSMALKALLQNRLQALLTLCGMSIGVAMVVIVSGLGRGAQLQIESQIESAGPTLVTVFPGNYMPPAINTGGRQDSGGGELSEGSMGGGVDGATTDIALDFSSVAEARARMQKPRQTKSRSPAWPLDADDMALVRSTPNVRAAAGSLVGNMTLDPESQHIVRTARLFGFEAAWPDMHGWKLVAGRWPSASEANTGAPLALVSAAVAARLWPDGKVLGQSLSFKGTKITVVGVIDDGEEAGTTIIVPTIYVPTALVQNLLGRTDYDQIKVRSTSVGFTTEVAATLREQLRNLRQLPDDTIDDFRVETQSVGAIRGAGMDPRLQRAVNSNVVEFELESWQEMAKSLRKAGRTFTLLLSAAAAVSLVVGGIGVMNIMLVSVAARTREIGLRMALGARMRDVMVQFMVEAVTLAALSGLVGLVLGYVGLMSARHGLQWATALSPAMLLLAVAMAALTGILFGYGPARRAASLDPVVALKAE
jgi:ABC-type antimicrobial peptide transport system, permease component